MRYRVIALFCLFAAPLLCCAQYRNGTGYESLSDTDAQGRMRRDVEFFASDANEGRKAGSEGEAAAADYFSGRLAEIGVDIVSTINGDTFGIRQESGDTLASRNVIGYIPGYDPSLKQRYIVIGARLDNLGSYDVTVNGELNTRICNGANGNASGLSMLLELARRLSSSSVLLRRSVLLVAFGASQQSNAGAWYFLNRSFTDVQGIDAMVNLDMLGTGASSFYAYTASDKWLNNLIANLAGTLQPVQPTLVSMEPCPSDHRAFYEKGIPSVMFTTGMFPEYNTWRDVPSIVDYANMERELEYIYNFTIALAGAQRTVQDAEKEDKVIPYYECDYKPSFLGSTDPANFLKKWVYVYLRYPERAIRNGVQGKVLVDFVIDEKGKVRDVKVLKGVDEDLDEEAVRIISSSPDWKPGRVRGKKVKCGMSLYVEFRLEKKKKK